MSSRDLLVGFLDGIVSGENLPDSHVVDDSFFGKEFEEKETIGRCDDTLRIYIRHSATSSMIDTINWKILLYSLDYKPWKDVDKTIRQEERPGVVF